MKKLTLLLAGVLCATSIMTQVSNVAKAETMIHRQSYDLIWELSDGNYSAKGSCNTSGAIYGYSNFNSDVYVKVSAQTYTQPAGSSTHVPVESFSSTLLREESTLSRQANTSTYQLTQTIFSHYRAAYYGEEEVVGSVIVSPGL